MSYTPVAEESLVFINGVKQAQNSYVINLDTIVFSSGLSEGDSVEVVKINRIQKETEYHNPVALFKQTIDSDVIVPVSYNALSVDPVISSGVTVTVSEGSTWAIVGE